MKKILTLLIFLTIFMNSPVYGHKLISHDGTNISFDTALKIPDHKIIPLRPTKGIRFMLA